MIRLFGVMHGGYAIDLLFRKREIKLEPTIELEEQLEQIPAGSKVGIENLSPEDWSEVKDNLKTLCWDNGLNIEYRTSSVYWNRIAQICRLCGHDILWLEDKENWFSYNKAFIEVGKITEKHEELYLEEGDSDRDYHEKLVTLNEEAYGAQISSDRIRLIDRDKAILRNIALQDVEAVVAGIVHTDAWMLDPSGINKEYGIEFGQYSTDSVADSQRPVLRFSEEAIPDPNVAYNFTGLRKAISLLERGAFSDERPDWVGIWDVHKPSEGYFELFVDEQTNGNMSGRIEDSSGTARFEGEITPRFVKLVKSYEVSTNDAIKSDIIYQTEDAGYDRLMHQGFFRGNMGGGAFYMEKPEGNSPLQMSMSWYDLRHKDESGQRR